MYVIALRRRKPASNPDCDERWRMDARRNDAAAARRVRVRGRDRGGRSGALRRWAADVDVPTVGHASQEPLGSERFERDPRVPGADLKLRGDLLHRRTEGG